MKQSFPPYVLEQERAWRILGAVLIVVLVGSAIALVAVGCGQEIFPTCKDPKHPCPPVEPNYPDPTPFGARRDGGSDSGKMDPGARF